MFDVLGVIDLRGGSAVQAQGGRRDRYQPVDRVANVRIEPGNAQALVRHYVERLGIKQLYVADLDAIEHRAPQHTVVSAIAAQDTPVWLDAGIASADEARVALAIGARRVVVGLETLPSFTALASIGEEIGVGRTVFSLDLRNGEPIAVAPALARQRPEALVTQAVEAGAGTVIVLDLARVGTHAGLDLDLIERLRIAVPAVTLIAGGGVRGRDDLVRLKNAGCSGALVATAILNGDITADDVSAVQER